MSQAVPERRHLPNRRASWTQKAKIGGQTIHLTFGEYPDGTLGDIFVDVAKTGSALRALLDSLAIFLSIGIQHGIPVKIYVDAIKGIDFLPKGEVVGSGAVHGADSILDYIAREIEQNYLVSANPVPEKVAGTISTGSGF